MKVEIVRRFSCPKEQVMKAYEEAIKEKFDKKVTVLSESELSFKLKYSWKYNMNGGRCTVQFNESFNSTTVVLKYNVAQLWLARCYKHESDIAALIEKLSDIHSSTDKETKLKEQAVRKSCIFCALGCVGLVISFLLGSFLLGIGSAIVLFYACKLNKRLLVPVITLSLILLCWGMAQSNSSGGRGCSICGDDIFWGKFCKKHFNSFVKWFDGNR